MDIDARLRRQIYDEAIGRGAPPPIAELARALGASDADVRASLERLAAGRIVVLQPESGEILMAPPFSAVPTPFVVETTRYACQANCAWDALGVPMMLHEPARIVSACGCCGAALSLAVSPERAPGTAAAVVHFGVPARRWWDDMVFT